MTIMETAEDTSRQFTWNKLNTLSTFDITNFTGYRALVVPSVNQEAVIPMCLINHILLQANSIKVLY